MIYADFRKAWLAGFDFSREGWNGEHPGREFQNAEANRELEEAINQAWERQGKHG